MYFPKLEIIKKHNQMNEYLVNKFDHWLASQSEMYSEYLNPLLFIEECLIERKLGVLVFALATNKKYFPSSDPLLKVKYIIDCPYCLENYSTYYDRHQIPIHFVKCDNETCETFVPVQHPERINIFFVRMERPIIKDEEELQIYEKGNTPSLTLADEDYEMCLWEIEESKGI